tara:strand:- start:4833 stop:5921 length:1089 start_codon:yes stop_codon:yes gene_type:complete
MSIFVGPLLLILLVGIELLVLKALNKPIPWAEVSMNLNSGQILLWLGRGLEVLGYYYLATLIPYQLTDDLGFFWVLLIAFILWDHQFYWLHNLHHKVPLLWYIHEVHHQGQHFNSSLGIRNSWFSSISSLPFFLPLVLVGIPVEVFVLVSSVHYFVQFYNHNDIIKHPKWMEKIFITPSLHKVHHGVNIEYLNKNCGGTFSIWDRIYGTHQQELEHVKVKLGIRKDFSTGSPILVNILPFLKSPRPNVKLNNNPLLNFASFLLYIQLLSFIAIQEQLTIVSGTVFVVFIVLGTVTLGLIQEGKRHGWSLWILNLTASSLAMNYIDLFDFQQVIASVIATIGYTSIVVFWNLSGRIKKGQSLF